MKIAVLCAWWKRANITEVHLKSFYDNPCPYAEVSYFAVISPEDPEYKLLILLAKKYKVNVLLFENDYLGMKHNAGVNYIANNVQCDWMMNIGSDDCLTPETWEYYRNKFKNCDCFGISNVFITCAITGETIFWDRPSPTDGIILGAGRMVNIRVLKHFVRKERSMYMNSYNSGLDTCSQQAMEREGFTMKKWNNGKRDIVHAYKVNTAINHFLKLKQYVSQ